jgi:hypothetical protein
MSLKRVFRIHSGAKFLEIEDLRCSAEPAIMCAALTINMTERIQGETSSKEFYVLYQPCSYISSSEDWSLMMREGQPKTTIALLKPSSFVEKTSQRRAKALILWHDLRSENAWCWPLLLGM